MPETKSSENCVYQTTQLSKKGRGLTSDGRIEVFGALAFEEVLARPAGRKKAFLRKVLRASSDRVEPRCSHCPDCGGCALQQMDYQAQLQLKQKRVQELFEMEVQPILGCKDPYRYRNKMEFSFSENREGKKFLGLMLAGSRGHVFNLEECYLASPWFSKVLARVRAFWESSELSAYHHFSNEGHLRTLTLREAIQGKGKMVILTVSGNPDYAIPKRLLDEFVAAVKGEEEVEGLSIFLQVQQLAKGRPTQFFEMLLFGPDHITERLHIQVGNKRQTLDFKISPTSFFQPNTKQAELLYSAGLSMIRNLKGARVFDLYCGGATLGLSAAPFAKEIVGVELNHHSVFDARWNQEINQIENFSIIRGDVAKVLEDFTEPPDVVIVDPPRAGLSEKALTHLIRFKPKEILYISCNPKTQVENISIFHEAGYRVTEILPVDQFPHTVHLENIVHLEYS